MPPHKIFLIPEILEQILLQTPPQTLLTTAQRTSQTWHHLITTSPRLQETLFFKPQPQPPNPRTKTTNRTLNPLLPHKIWPHLFRKRLASQTTTTTNYGYTLPPADPVEEELYLRPNASWRRMLVQQPPTSSISVFVMHRSWISCDEDISPVKVFTADVEFLTLGHLHWSAFVGCLLPLERVACFWDFGDYYRFKDVEWRREMELAVERFGDGDKVPDLTEPTNPWLLPFFVAKNKGPLRSRRDGLGVDWPLGFTGSRRRHGHGSNKAGAGRVGSLLSAESTSSCDRGIKSKLRNSRREQTPIGNGNDVKSATAGRKEGRREGWVNTKEEGLLGYSSKAPLYRTSCSSRVVGCQKFVWRNTTSGDRFVKPRYNAWNVGVRTKRRAGKTGRP
ncbi:hypothetical protein BDV30DRAFT_232292 [Aspergillus minisclerotigenes]|uniref:F-box domain-containing protein n=1 Tax=Aspergillus minisclerotigenes TaxID=656917 RepID=A0A5N6IKE8_9EURO|nr:hypothetical protein BDV30DRAFT_232292 [Aspergillus minisclerotigenes]